MDTIAAALAWARAQLAGQPRAEPLDATVLLAHVLGVERAYLLAHPEAAVTPAHAERYRDLIMQRAAGVPVAYLLQRRAFFDREFFVGPGALIPRPETEHVIEAALAWARTRPAGELLRVADIGSGSGILAVTLAAHLPDAQVWAVDVSPDALAWTRRNADAQGVAERMRIVQGDLLEPLIAAGAQVDLLVANLPYIPSAEVDTLDVLEHEPRTALDGGLDGLDLIRRLLADAPRVLVPNGLILLEMMAGQGAAVSALGERAFPGAEVRIIYDYAGHDRIVRIAPVAQK